MLDPYDLQLQTPDDGLDRRALGHLTLPMPSHTGWGRSQLLWEAFSLSNNATPMTSTTPPTRPETQAQATPVTVPGSAGPDRRPWLEPAVLVAVLGLAVAILALLLSIAFGIYSMNTRIDALGARIDALETSFNTRIDALGANFNTRIDTLGANLNARIDTLGGDLNARIEQVYQLLLPREQ